MGSRCNLLFEQACQNGRISGSWWRDFTAVSMLQTVRKSFSRRLLPEQWDQEKILRPERIPPGMFPEPELTLFVTSNAKIVGYTIGNDVSSRSIEGENPLYLPQAKTFDNCACLGPCILVPETPLPPETSIEMKISRESEVVFEGKTSLREMKRKPEELVDYLFRETSFAQGVFLMTGTGIVPGTEFSLNWGSC